MFCPCRANHESEPRALLLAHKAGHIYFVRKNASRGGNKATLPESVFEIPAFGGGFFLSGAVGLTASASAPKEEGRPSRWKDGLARSLMHCNRPVQ